MITHTGGVCLFFHRLLYHLHAQEDEQKATTLGMGKESSCSEDSILVQLFFFLRKKICVNQVTKEIYL